MNAVNWTPGLVATVFGAVAGTGLVLFHRRSGSVLSEQQDQLADLEQRVSALLEELRELVQDQHLLTAEEFALERGRIEKEAAAALRERDAFAKALTEASAAPAPVQAPAPSPLMNPTLKGALYGGGTVLFFVVLGLLLGQESTPRNDGVPVTGGGAPAAAAPAEAPPDPQFDGARAQLEKNPNDVELAAAVAHGLLAREQLGEAQRLTQHALGLDPFHTEHRVHAAMLRGMRGETVPALEELERIGRAHPDGTEALLFAGGLALELGEPRRALGNFEAYKAAVPPGQSPPRLEHVISLIRQQLGEAPAPAAPPTGALPPPLSPEQMAAAQAAAQGPELQARAAGLVDEAERELLAGRFQEALERYKQVMPVMPENGRAKAGMAWALIQLGKQPMADRVWSVAVSSDPAAVASLGDRLDSAGQAAAARTLRERLVQSAAEWGGVDAVRAKLR
jgi:tetratricopeptide (TPR) repeat protein